MINGFCQILGTSSSSAERVPGIVPVQSDHSGRYSFIFQDQEDPDVGCTTARDIHSH